MARRNKGGGRRRGPSNCRVLKSERPSLGALGDEAARGIRSPRPPISSPWVPIARQRPPSPTIVSGEKAPTPLSPASRLLPRWTLAPSPPTLRRHDCRAFRRLWQFSLPVRFLPAPPSRTTTKEQRRWGRPGLDLTLSTTLFAVPTPELSAFARFHAARS